MLTTESVYLEQIKIKTKSTNIAHIQPPPTTLEGVSSAASCKSSVRSVRAAASKSSSVTLVDQFLLLIIGGRYLKGVQDSSRLCCCFGIGGQIAIRCLGL